MATSPIHFCSTCGAKVVHQIPSGDSVFRAVCPACHTIHYQNPKIVAGCIPEWHDQILLCRRGIEPRYGLWTFPAGFMEMGESSEEAAIRETLEEAQAAVDHLSLYAVYSLPHVSQVYIIYRGRLQKPEFGAGEESLEVELVPSEKIPWDSLAFPVIRQTLLQYTADRQNGAFGVHFGAVRPKM